MLLYHSQRAFIYTLPCDIQNHPVSNIGQWLSQTRVWVPGTQSTFEKSVDRSSDSWCLTSSTYYRSNTHWPVLSLFHSQQWPKQGTWEVSQGLTVIPWASPLRAHAFWEGLYLATNVLRYRGPETKWKGEEGSPLESSGGIGRTLLFSVPLFFLLLCLPRRKEQK